VSLHGNEANADNKGRQEGREGKRRVKGRVRKGGEGDRDGARREERNDFSYVSWLRFPKIITGLCTLQPIDETSP